VELSKTLTPSIEYFAALGFFPGAAWKIGERIMWGFGVGVGVSNAIPEVVLKSRIEYEFSE
jgi:hypothetical protein